MVMEGDLTWGGEHIIQYTDNILYNSTPGTYIISLTNVTLINSIKNKSVITFMNSFHLYSPCIFPEYCIYREATFLLLF